MRIFWKRSAITTGAVFFLLIPIGLVVFRYPQMATMLPRWLRLGAAEIDTARFSVASSIPKYHLVLVDTAFLDYMSGKLGVFNGGAIIDRKYQNGMETEEIRHTIERVRFVLVPVVDSPVYMTAEVGPDPRVVPVPWGKTGYEIQQDTLVIQVYLDIPVLTRGVVLQKFTLEDKFLQMALSALYYATSYKGTKIDAEALSAIKMQIQDNLYSGILPWPFRIEGV